MNVLVLATIYKVYKYSFQMTKMFFQSPKRYTYVALADAYHQKSIYVILHFLTPKFKFYLCSR